MEAKTLDEFEEILFAEWANPKSKATDPVVIVEEINLHGNRRYHIYVISEQWPLDSTPLQRSYLIVRVAEKVNKKLADYAAFCGGYTPEEAKERNLNYIVSHPDFDITKPHDSEEVILG